MILEAIEELINADWDGTQNWTISKDALALLSRQVGETASPLLNWSQPHGVL